MSVTLVSTAPTANTTTNTSTTTTTTTTTKASQPPIPLIPLLEPLIEVFMGRTDEVVLGTVDPRRKYGSIHLPRLLFKMAEAPDDDITVEANKPAQIEVPLKPFRKPSLMLLMGMPPLPSGLGMTGWLPDIENGKIVMFAVNTTSSSITIKKQSIRVPVLLIL